MKPSLSKRPPTPRAHGDRIGKQAASTSFPVVGVGASAGGLGAFSQLLEHLPPDTGMAFVLIQHLDPTHDSLLARALSRGTKMRVSQVKSGEPIERNHVYVIPPNAGLEILDGILTLLPRPAKGSKFLPIDFFFRSLAQERGTHAIGVILSGTASDGTEGLSAIKAENGITFAQDPDSAQFDGMPRSALEAGVVDYCLSIPKLAEELIRLSRHPYVADGHPPPQARDEASQTQILSLVRNTVGVDFSEYKTATVQRRLARRIALREAEGLRGYLELLRGNPTEVRSLYEDILIHVSSFFRDPDVFEHLKSEILPEIVKHKSEGAPIRIWVAGCSEGEEVYSIAICLLEFLGKSAAKYPIQIFGSDVSEKAIEKARAGLYRDSAMRDVSDERRRRYFTRVDADYRINKTVREMCVFVRHDLARDPPFAKLDLVSCRNVLIYFGSALQRRVVPMFHYALNPRRGFLLLGHAENIGNFRRLFSPAGKSSKFFTRMDGASGLKFAPRLEVHPRPPAAAIRPLAEFQRRGYDLARHVDRLLLARYAPPGVLVNERMEILQYFGETGRYLRPAPGEPQNNLLKMARAGLGPELRAAISAAKKQSALVTVRGVKVDADGLERTCDVVVAPFTETPDATEQFFIVSFEETLGHAHGKGPARKSFRRQKMEGTRSLPKLARELATTKKYLQSLVDDRDRTNDDLNSANEELVSGNEELQSMNEEMETAKEELQSTNEELTTVNEELHSRNQEVNEINGDLVNILSAVDLPILILDRERRIRRFTPKARSILNVLISDLGRPLEDIRSNLTPSDLDQHVADVIERNVVHESEVQDRTGRWYRMQIRPYINLENKIDGATLSLVDIDSLKHHVGEAQRAKSEAERANQAKDDFLATLSHELRTPLSSMLMQAQLLRRGKMDDAKVQRAGEAIERGTRLQVKLIDDLLDVSRIVTGKLQIEIKPVQLVGVIKAALEAVSAPAEKKGLTFKIALDEDVRDVAGDATRLQQVMTNLLINAVKFSADHAQITVTLDSADECARIRIADTGAGIEPSFLPHVFNRFAQEDGSTIRKHGGLGLGLAIVRHLVEAHGGTVSAASEGKEKGAEFSVLLPLLPNGTPAKQGIEASPSPSLALRASAKSNSRSRELKGLRILVVDDDAASRDAVADMLRESGAQVRVAESAIRALTEVANFRPELLLCDIAMPGEDGYSLIRKVRAMGKALGGGVLPALAFTALAGEVNRSRALSAGFQMHLAKPVDVDQLTQAVVELLHRGGPVSLA